MSFSYMQKSALSYMTPINPDTVTSGQKLTLEEPVESLLNPLKSFLTLRAHASQKK